jgi:preprotein translocase subunit SecD
MKATLLALTFALAFSAAADEKPALEFYVISPKKIEGGRFIDTKEFPKLGHISAKPELKMASLKSVALRRLPGGDTTIGIHLKPAQSDAFAKFTAQHVGQKILLMLEGKPLMAPTLREKIRTPALQLSIPDKTKRKQILQSLQKLVPAKD